LNFLSDAHADQSLRMVNLAIDYDMGGLAEYERVGDESRFADALMAHKKEVSSLLEGYGDRGTLFIRVRI